MRSTEHLLRSPFHLLRDLDGVAVAAATRHHFRSFDRVDARISAQLN
jgi:hypothetical protein